MIVAIKAEIAVSDKPKDALHDTTEVEMLDAKEKWNEYRLADGTTLRLKPVMIAVFHNGQRTPDGDPIYNMKSTSITDVRSLATLAKPEPTECNPATSFKPLRGRLPFSFPPDRLYPQAFLSPTRMRNMSSPWSRPLQAGRSPRT